MNLKSQQKSGPKDVFLHVLVILALYFSAGSFIALIFQYINLYFPDVLEQDYYHVNSGYDGIRWAISTLIVVFPGFIFLSRHLNKTYEQDPEKRSLKTRKWLLYFTVSAAAVIMAGDVVSLIYRFLGGELTGRFALKVLTVLFAAGSIFYYYLSDLKKHKIE